MGAKIAASSDLRWYHAPDSNAPSYSSYPMSYTAPHVAFLDFYPRCGLEGARTILCQANVQSTAVLASTARKSHGFLCRETAVTKVHATIRPGEIVCEETL
jgi:hypothetical protein